jgi:hypothetical protein
MKLIFRVCQTDDPKLRNAEKQHCEMTPLRLQHTIPRKAATQETQEHPGADWNLQGSRWQLFIGSILMLTWTRRFT